jgi:hypothetical protein
MFIITTRNELLAFSTSSSKVLSLMNISCILLTNNACPDLIIIFSAFAILTNTNVSSSYIIVLGTLDKISSIKVLPANHVFPYRNGYSSSLIITSDKQLLYGYSSCT